ncbi:MAG TPA: hypothetical protein VHO23_01645 [Candidatus Paceibacterota bacterium]|nr:hypothetical protein [Candidatus Paceibacterota bacterium]
MNVAASKKKGSNRFYGVSLLMIGAGLLALSAFAGHELVRMIVDAGHYGSALISLGADQTLPVGPQSRFLGDGLIGTYAPTFFAIVGTLAFMAGWRALEKA